MYVVTTTMIEVVIEDGFAIVDPRNTAMQLSYIITMAAI